MTQDDGFYRINEIILPDGLLKISRSKWYAGIKDGIFPRGYKIGATTVWHKPEIHDLIKRILS